MKKQTIIDLIKAYSALQELHYRAATEAMSDPSGGGPHEVYEQMKDSMNSDSKRRRLENRYSHVLQGK